MLHRPALWGMLFCFFLKTQSSAQVFADVTTSLGKFTIQLDHVNAPLAVTNFILLAGKEDDLWRGSNVASTPIGNYTHPQLLNLNVEFFDNPSPFVPPVYRIKQSNIILGTLDAATFEDTSGLDHYSLFWSVQEGRWHLTIHYPHSWIDPKTNQIKNTPYYNDLPISRILRNQRFFMGSINNSTFDGPGYRFQDELSRVNNAINPWGTPFNSTYVVGMDSFGPNTNGSRFFITIAGDTSLNGNFTPIGTIPPSPGRRTVQEIATIPTNDDLTPASDIRLNSISIRKLGSAVSFMEALHRQNLPSAPREIDLDIRQENGVPALVFSSPPFSSTSLTFSTDLINYTSPFTIATPPDQASFTYSLDTELNTLPKAFFRAFQVTNPLQPANELNLSNAQLRLQISSPTPEVIVLNFSASGEFGTYISTLRPAGSFSASYQADGAYTGTLQFISTDSLSDLNELRFYFGSDPELNPVNVYRRFKGLNAGEDFPLTFFEGVWQKTN